MALDVSSLWNFDDPEQTEQRFRLALTTLSGDDALIVQTQIARTFGLRRDFPRARAILADIEGALGHAGPEVRVRYHLELGRSFASAAHPIASQTTEAKDTARSCYARALDDAKAAQLDALAIDAVHMLAFVDTAPDEQLKWGREALAIVLASHQDAAKKWEASVRNNIGYALFQLKEYAEALAEFQRALVLREKAQNTGAIWIAYWMVAKTLRAMDRTDEALDIQLRLERERDAAGLPSPYVYEELEALYRLKKDDTRADWYFQKREATKGK